MEEKKFNLQEGQVVETDYNEDMIVEDLQGLENNDESILIQDVYNSDELDDMLDEDTEVITYDNDTEE